MRLGCTSALGTALAGRTPHAEPAARARSRIPPPRPRLGWHRRRLARRRRDAGGGPRRSPPRRGRPRRGDHRHELRERGAAARPWRRRRARAAALRLRQPGLGGLRLRPARRAPAPAPPGRHARGGPAARRGRLRREGAHRAAHRPAVRDRSRPPQPSQDRPDPRARLPRSAQERGRRAPRGDGGPAPRRRPARRRARGLRDDRARRARGRPRRRAGHQRHQAHRGRADRQGRRHGVRPPPRRRAAPHRRGGRAHRRRRARHDRGLRGERPPDAGGAGRRGRRGGVGRPRARGRAAAGDPPRGRAGSLLRGPRPPARDGDRGPPLRGAARRRLGDRRAGLRRGARARDRVAPGHRQRLRRIARLARRGDAGLEAGHLPRGGLRALRRPGARARAGDHPRLGAAPLRHRGRDLHGGAGRDAAPPARARHAPGRAPASGAGARAERPPHADPDPPPGVARRAAPPAGGRRGRPAELLRHGLCRRHPERQRPERERGLALGGVRGIVRGRRALAGRAHPRRAGGGARVVPGGGAGQRRGRDVPRHGGHLGLRAGRPRGAPGRASRALPHRRPRELARDARSGHGGRRAPRRGQPGAARPAPRPSRGGVGREVAARRRVHRRRAGPGARAPLRRLPPDRRGQPRRPPLLGGRALALGRGVPGARLLGHRDLHAPLLRARLPGGGARPGRLPPPHAARRAAQGPGPRPPGRPLRVGVRRHRRRDDAGRGALSLRRDPPRALRGAGDPHQRRRGLRRLRLRAHHGRPGLPPRARARDPRGDGALLGEPRGEGRGRALPRPGGDRPGRVPRGRRRQRLHQLDGPLQPEAGRRRGRGEPRRAGVPGRDAGGGPALAEDRRRDVPRPRRANGHRGAVRRLLRARAGRPRRPGHGAHAGRHGPGQGAHTALPGGEAGRRGHADRAALGRAAARGEAPELPLLRAAHGPRQLAEPGHPRPLRPAPRAPRPRGALPGRDGLHRSRQHHGQLGRRRPRRGPREPVAGGGARRRGGLPFAGRRRRAADRAAPPALLPLPRLPPRVARAAAPGGRGAGRRRGGGGGGRPAAGHPRDGAGRAGRGGARRAGYAACDAPFDGGGFRAWEAVS